jgi:hypothetical protein
MADSLDVIRGVATVALIVYATRWLSTAKGAQVPRTRDKANVYDMKWQIRAVGLVGAFGCAAWLIASRYDSFAARNRFLLLIPAVFLLLCLWFAIGSVTTDQSGITKKSLWRSRSLRWDEITEVQLHKRDGGAIELHAGLRKLIIDSRFVATTYLLDEIVDRTKLQPRKD